MVYAVYCTVKPALRITSEQRTRRRGLVVRDKTHVREVMGSNPSSAVETIYHAPLIWIKSLKAKIVEKITWHSCVCCNPAKGRVEFEDGWLLKPSFITKKKNERLPVYNGQLKPQFSEN
jgi:hypothetical protein